MRKVTRVWLVALLGLSLAPFVWAGPRDGKGSSIGFHRISATAADGFRSMPRTDGTTLFVSSKPVGTAMDVVSAAGTQGGVEVKLSGAAARRLSGEVAIVMDGQLVSTATVGTDGGIRVGGLSPDQASRLLDTATGRKVAPRAGTIVSAVYGGRDGDRYLLDIFIQGVQDLRSYQFVLVSGGADAGRLELEDVIIDAAREDYVFGEERTVEAASPYTGRLANVLYDGGADAVTPRYLGTYVFRASPDASGTFRINIESSRDSLIANSKNEEMPFSIGIDALIPVGVSRDEK